MSVVNEDELKAKRDDINSLYNDYKLNNISGLNKSGTIRVELIKENIEKMKKKNIWSTESGQNAVNLLLDSASTLEEDYTNANKVVSISLSEDIKWSKYDKWTNNGK